MIKSAELPLNARKAVYHLDLLPEELADTVITVGDPERVHQVSRHFDQIELKRSHREFVTHTGWLGQTRLSVLSTGIGVPNIDIVLNELDALVNIDLTTRCPKKKTKSLNIIRLGTTGSLQKTCMPGDVIMSHFALGFDTLLAYYKTELSPELSAFKEAVELHMQGASGPFYVACADKALCKAFEEIGLASITATCGGFYGPQARMLRLPLHYTQFMRRLSQFQFEGFKIMNFEMETAGLLGLGGLLGHRCMSLSVVLANRITGEFVANPLLHTEALIMRSLDYICHLS